MASIPMPPAIADRVLPRISRDWVLPIGLAAYVLYVTWTWRFPDSSGVPFLPIWLAAVTATTWAWRRWRGPVGSLEATAIVVVTAMLMTDVTALWTQALRDLVLYLRAGERFLDGLPVYMEQVLTERPKDLTQYPFLYPPITLPLFAALSLLPLPIAAALWTAGSLAAVIAAFRLIGIDRRWCLFLLAWPPVLQGIYVGNVAVLLFLLFAAAPRLAGGLLAPVVFKLYNVIAAVWLIRERRWSELAAAAAVGIAIAAITAPIVPLGLWIDWIDGLRTYQASQQALPNYLYGLGLGRYGVPLILVAVVGVVLTVLALRARDPRERLARLGLATVAASPSVFAHGFLVAVPALFSLRTRLVWLVLGITACSPGLAWWIAPTIAAAAWFLPGLRRGPGADPWHPLVDHDRPWPHDAAPEPEPETRPITERVRGIGLGGRIGPIQPSRDG